MERILSLDRKSSSNYKLSTSREEVNITLKHRNYFRRKFHQHNSWNMTSLKSSLLPSTSLSLTLLKYNSAVLVLTILLGLIQNSLSSPVFVNNPSITQFQSGRNIRHLPCIVRKSGLSGTCMFAIDCIKQNGTHLGTCIDRFYFGSCCRIQDEFYTQDINDNSIDQNTISHFLNEVNTTPSTIGLYKPTLEQNQESSQHKAKPTLPVPYVPISTVIPSLQNRENFVNSSSNEITDLNSILNDPTVEILSTSQTSSVSMSSTKINNHTSPSIASHHNTDKPLNENQALPSLIVTEKIINQSIQKLPPSISHSSAQPDNHKQTISHPTKHTHIITNKPTTSNIPQSSIHKISTHKIPTHHTSANEILKETLEILQPTKVTSHIKHSTIKKTNTSNKITRPTISNNTTKIFSTTQYTTQSTPLIPILTTTYPAPMFAENQFKETTESIKFTTFQMVETTTFTSTTTPETKKPFVTQSKPTKTASPIIYVSNKPLYSKRPLTTNRTKGTKRPTGTSKKPSNSSIASTTRHPTITTIKHGTTIRKTTNSPSKKPIIVTKKPLTTRPPIPSSSVTKPTSSLITTIIPSKGTTIKIDALNKTDSLTTIKTTKIPAQSTKAPRPNPKPTADIIRVSSTTINTDSEISTIKLSTFQSVENNFSNVNVSSTTTKPLSSSSPTHSSTTNAPIINQTSFVTSISSTEIKTTKIPITTQKPSPSISTKKSTVSISTTSSFKQPTTKQPKPISTKFPTIRPSHPRPSSTEKSSSNGGTSLITKMPISQSSTTKHPLSTLSPQPLTTTKPSSSKLPIITKHPLTTKPPLTTITTTHTEPTTKISYSPVTTTSLKPTTSTTTMKPSGLVTWTNEANAPSNNASTSVSESDNIEEDWQPKPQPDWAVKPSNFSSTESNKTNAESPSNSPKPSEPTTEDIIASSISSVLDQLNNKTATNNVTYTTENPWLWTTESKINTTTSLSTIMEGLANISNATTSTIEGFNNVTSSTTPTIPSLEGIDYKQICGKRMYPEPRIVGGANAAFGRWPWQISLRQWRTSTYLHKCGAALLNENWAITAAHCVDNVPPSDLLLRLGEYDLAEEEEPYSYQERRVQIVASHPQFDPRTFEYDLALLRFYEPVVFQPNIIPVCVPDNDYDFLGQTAYVTGWGRLYEDGPLPSVLQEVSVPVINNTICETMYRSAGYIEHIPHIFICAGWTKGGYDSCEGDSGGPMVLQRERDKRFVLGGVISWGIGCAEPNQPGVYTRISEFRDWINQILQF